MVSSLDTDDGTNAWRDVRVSLGPDAEVSGKLSFSVPTRIEGKLKGELRASDLLIIGAQATINATVHAEQLIVLGEVRGQVTGVARVEICTGGRVVGDLETRCLVIHEGAFFEGRSRMGQQPAAADAAGGSKMQPSPPA